MPSPTVSADAPTASVLTRLALGIVPSLDAEEVGRSFLDHFVSLLGYSQGHVWTQDAAATPTGVRCLASFPLRHKLPPSSDGEAAFAALGTSGLGWIEAPRTQLVLAAGAEAVIVLEAEGLAPLENEAAESLRPILERFGEALATGQAHERALLENEAKFTALFDQSHDGILLYDLDGRIRDANQRAEMLFGCTAEVLCAQRFDDLLHERARDSYQFTLESLVLDGFAGFELVFERAGGASFTAAVAASVIEFCGQRLIQAVLRDVTEQKESELALQESLMRLFTVVETVEEGITLYDPEADHFEVFNSKMQEITGYPRHEANRPDFFHRLYPGAADVPALVDGLYRGVDVRNAETTITARDGSQKTLLVSTALVVQRRKPMYLTAARDITERKRAEAEIQRLKSFYEQVLEEMPVELAVFDLEGRYVYVNPSAVGDSERRRAMIGTTVYDHVRTRGLGASLAEGRLAHIRHAAETGTMVKFEETFDSSEGRRHFLRLVSPVFTPEGVVDQILGFGLDITERKEAEETLREAKALAEQSAMLKEQFLANMSHEIRTPLNAVLGMTSLLLETRLSAKQRKYLEAVSYSADTLLVLINDILDLSKINAGRISFEEVPYRLSDVVGGLSTMLQLRANEKRLALSFDVAPDVPDALVGDPVRLHQILINLVGNALKFTEEGGITVRIGTAQRPATADVMLRIEVADTGIGIALDRQASIFESFTQAASDTTRTYGGTGLGLAIVKQLVELQGGEIALSSTPGEGTTFRFTLPADIASEEDVLPSAPAEPANVRADLTGVRVLVVEDNPFNQMVAQGILEGWNADVTMAENGRQAVEAVGAASFDLVLMDIRMPEMNGLDATRHIRRMDTPARDVPILALTASALAERRSEVLAAGMNDFVTKPFVPDQLYRLILKHMDRLPTEATGNAAPAESATDADANERSAADEQPARPRIDLALVEANAFGKPERVVRMIDLFLNVMPDQLAALEEAQREADWPQVGFVVHKMKSAIGMFGAQAVAERILAVERHVRDGEAETSWDVAWLEAEAATIRTEVALVLEEIRALRSDYVAAA